MGSRMFILFCAVIQYYHHLLPRLWLLGAPSGQRSCFCDKPPPQPFFLFLSTSFLSGHHPGIDPFSRAWFLPVDHVQTPRPGALCALHHGGRPVGPLQHSVRTHSHISVYRQILSLHGHLGAQANTTGRRSLHLPSAAVRGPASHHPRRIVFVQLWPKVVSELPPAHTRPTGASELRPARTCRSFASGVPGAARTQLWFTC